MDLVEPIVCVPDWLVTAGQAHSRLARDANPMHRVPWWPHQCYSENEVNNNKKGADSQQSAAGGFTLTLSTGGGGGHVAVYFGDFQAFAMTEAFTVNDLELRNQESTRRGVGRAGVGLR